jgi:hypothetical protein
LLRRLKTEIKKRINFRFKQQICKKTLIKIKVFLVLHATFLEFLYLKRENTEINQIFYTPFYFTFLSCDNDGLNSETFSDYFNAEFTDNQYNELVENQFINT